MKRLLVSVITAIFFFSISCSDNKVVPEGPEIFDINGSWVGTTSQNYEVSFVVAGSAVTEFNIMFDQTSVSTSNSTYLSLGNVVDNAFSFSSDMFGVTEITGNFLSNTSSGGTFAFDAASVTWTAAKQ